ISSSALIGSAMSHPKRCGTWGASLLATAAPNGLETPVTRTRLGVIDSQIYWSGAKSRMEWSGAKARIYSGRPQAGSVTAPDALHVKGGFRGGILIPPRLNGVERKPGCIPGVPQTVQLRLRTH